MLTEGNLSGNYEQQPVLGGAWYSCFREALPSSFVFTANDPSPKRLGTSKICESLEISSCQIKDIYSCSFKRVWDEYYNLLPTELAVKVSLRKIKKAKSWWNSISIFWANQSRLRDTTILRCHVIVLVLLMLHGHRNENWTKIYQCICESGKS